MKRKFSRWGIAFVAVLMILVQMPLIGMANVQDFVGEYTSTLVDHGTSGLNFLRITEDQEVGMLFYIEDTAVDGRYSIDTKVKVLSDKDDTIGFSNKFQVEKVSAKTLLEELIGRGPIGNNEMDIEQTISEQFRREVHDPANYETEELGNEARKAHFDYLNAVLEVIKPDPAPYQFSVTLDNNTYSELVRLKEDIEAQVGHVIPVVDRLQAHFQQVMEETAAYLEGTVQLKSDGDLIYDGPAESSKPMYKEKLMNL
ncbi:hypothetical protein [Dolosicoccus paucivorans]|uniref:hypothetical protein n=1 Tax=Dolosicoccus paucivorans TaxID=84521 RepID=UPI00088A1801|nr:hypothetical protein [Dolosicoccus paucivorans]SDI64252.1 hypothetical protein SAMN04487994_102916 [Dolosicoccus paucivorans]